MENKLIEYLSDVIESCGYSLPTVVIEEHAKEIIEIVDRKNVPNVIVVGQYMIKLINNNSLWMQHSNGEGMQVDLERLIPYIRKYFADNF